MTAGNFGFGVDLHRQVGVYYIFIEGMLSIVTSRTRLIASPCRRLVLCLLAFGVAGLWQDGTARAATPVTAWAGSVHQALARQARHAEEAAHRVFLESGLASWYGSTFAGRRTSSGIRFDPMKLTCAHRTLPLGSRVLVTSQATGRSVVVTVNDRGPYGGAGRIVDLSRAAASRLGMTGHGLGAVTLMPLDVEVAQAP